MALKPAKEAEVEGVGRILRIDTPFDAAVKAMEKVGAELIDTRDLAYARIKTGKNSSLSDNGSYTIAGYLYAANEPPLRARISPLLDADLAKKAVRANREGRYFSTDAGIYNKYLKMAKEDKSKKPEKRRVIILPSRETFSISPSTNKDVFSAAFEDVGVEYLSFIGQDSIKVYTVDKNTVDGQDGTILTQEWFLRLGDESGLVGLDRGLGYDDRVRGVLKEGDGASGRKIEAYTPKQLNAALKSLKMQGLEEQLLEVLREKH